MNFTRFRLFIAGFALIALFAGIFSHIATSNAAFGTSPPWVRNDHVLPGTTVEQVINLSRSDADKAVRATVRISGDKDLVKWIEVENEDNLVMEKGEQFLPMKVIITIPKRAALKNYIASIYTALEPVKDPALGGGEVAITLGANIVVEIEVIGDKIIDYRVKAVSIDPIEEGNPFSLKVQVENLGNTEISDIAGEIEIHNKAKTEMLESFSMIPLDDPLLPDEIKISRMIFEDIMLDAGEYWVVARIKKDGEILYENSLLQKIVAKKVPIVTPEDAIGEKPSLPGSAKTPDTTLSPDIQVPVSDIRPAAPVAAETNSIFLIFGLAGLGLGLVALIGIIIVLVIVVRRQGQTSQAQPVQPQVVPPVQVPPVQPQPQGNPENNNTGQQT